VFGFLPRPQLGKLVSLIADWYFASKAQFYLHECGQITLGHLDIEPSANGSGPVIVKGRQELPLADVPMPKNVQNFKHIFIRLVLGVSEKNARISNWKDGSSSGKLCYANTM
jgi:hypothetical protein